MLFKVLPYYFLAIALSLLYCGFAFTVLLLCYYCIITGTSVLGAFAGVCCKTVGTLWDQIQV